MDDHTADNAPIVHLLLTASFAPAIELLSIIDLAELFKLFEADYPVFQQLHRAGQMSANAQTGTFMVENVSTSPRVSFTSADLSSFMFFQDDRFSMGWNRSTASDIYPGFQAVYDQFERNLAIVNSWLSDRGSNVVPVVGELVYTDVFAMPPVALGDALSKTFTVMEPFGTFRTNSLECAWIESLPEGGEGFARVKVAGPALSPAGEPVLMFETTISFNLAGFPWHNIHTGFEMAHGVGHDVFRRVVNPAMRATL